jgi:hypothetical protein
LARYVPKLLCLFIDNFHNSCIMADVVALWNVENLILADFENVINFVDDGEVSN